MPRGYPDFFGQSIWPKYGTLYVQTALNTLIPTASTMDIFYLAGRAIVHSGYFSMHCDSELMFDSIFRLDGDGSLLSAQSGYNLTVRCFDIDTPSPFILRRYERGVRYVVIIHVARDISFATSFRIYLNNITGFDIDVGGGLYYYRQA